MGAGLGYTDDSFDGNIVIQKLQIYLPHIVTGPSVLAELKSNVVLLRNVFCPELAKTATGYLEVSEQLFCLAFSFFHWSWYNICRQSKQI
jgi:hypothetical protein